MRQKEKLAEFEKFTESEGKTVENGGVVMFGQDEAAAQAFADKTRKAGFQALVGLTQAQWVHGKDDSADESKEWGVNLL